RVLTSLEKHGVYRTVECLYDSFTDESFKEFIAQSATDGNSELLRWRKNNKLNTIMISNASPEKLYDLVGKFCYESIKNYSPVIPLKMVGPNRRTSSINGFNDASRSMSLIPKGRK
ncbi:MAG: hypothetical protein J6P70_06860, partial [Ruminobacter sp.]|nr:hypothetical protein [Ruminobacter sp.]